jgi:hypothetical protein
MSDTSIREAVERLKCAEDDEEWLETVRSESSRLDANRPDNFEIAATELAMATPRTIDFALKVLREGEERDENVRFLVFTMGAIAARRLQERTKSRELFEFGEEQFPRVPFLLHLRAVSFLDGSLEDLREGLKLEEHAYKETKPHAGAAHAIAEFIVRIADCDGFDGAEEEQELQRGLGFLDEAMAVRRSYAKYYATRGDIQRRLRRYPEARADFNRAIEYGDRLSVDAADRLRDYKLGLALINVDQAARKLNQASEEAVAETKEEVADLEKRTRDAVSRLDNAELGVLTAIAFVASAIGLVQVTVGNFGRRPFLEVITMIAALGVILFSAVGVGSWIMRRSRQP